MLFDSYIQKAKIKVRPYTLLDDIRLDNIIHCVVDALKNNVPGDFIETGVFKGGACLLVREIFQFFNIKNRKVWVADSFEGFPENNLLPDKKENIQLRFRGFKENSLASVQKTFQEFNFLDEQTVFVKGFFRDSLPACRIEHIAVLRTDGDMYASTLDALDTLYPKVQYNGWYIEDDYFDKGFSNARKAVDDYRLTHNISTPVKQAGNSCFWQKTN